MNAPFDIHEMARASVERVERRRAEDQKADAPDAGLLAAPDMGVLRLHRRHAVAFPLDVLGKHWAGWVERTAESAAGPVDYVAAALLPFASCLIGNARWAEAWQG